MKQALKTRFLRVRLALARIRASHGPSACYGVLILSCCGVIWGQFGLTEFRGESRQANRRILGMLGSFRTSIAASEALVWAITEERQPDNLLWRKVVYGLLPHRVPMLPYGIRPVTEPGVAANPANGGLATIGNLVGFESRAQFERYLRAMEVDYLLVFHGRPEVSRLTGLELQRKRAYLIMFDAASGAFQVVCSDLAP